VIVAFLENEFDFHASFRKQREFVIVAFLENEFDFHASFIRYGIGRLGLHSKSVEIKTARHDFFIPLFIGKSYSFAMMSITKPRIRTTVIKLTLNVRVRTKSQAPADIDQLQRVPSGGDSDQQVETCW
jgi:hypothetical protein